MAAITIKIVPGDYINEEAVENVIRYIMRLHNPLLVDGCGVFPLEENYIIGQFNYVKDYYNMHCGKKVFHMVISVDPSLRFDEYNLMKLGKLISRFFGSDRQVVYVVHNDTDNLHIHMCVNTVSFVNGKYTDFFDMLEIKEYAERCLSLVVDEKWFNKKCYTEEYNDKTNRL